MHSQRTILDLVDHIYSAVEDPRMWTDFLQNFAGALHSDAANLFVQNLRQPGGSAVATFNTDDSFNRSYAEHYGSINVFLIHGRPLLKSGTVSFSQELCPDFITLRSEFFNDWILPQGHERGLLGTIYAQNSLVGNIGAIRARGTKPFTLDHKHLVEELMPHLQRAVRLRGHISDLQLSDRTKTEVLDHWTTAVVLLDCNAQLIASNRAAAEIINQCDGLFSDRGTLKSASAKESSFLHHLIREAASRMVNGHTSGVMLIERPSGKRPLHVLICPSVSESAFFGLRGHALLFVSDPEAETTQAEILQKLYELTPAEGNVAELLASGKSVREIADETSVRENTVRIHLKRIFDKTGTKRQAELVKLVLSGAAVRRI